MPNRPSVEQLLARYESRWSDAGFVSAEEAHEHRRLGAQMLHEYVARQPPEGERPETLLRERMLKMDRGFYLLRGRLDRLDQWPDGTLEIVDYKSGRSHVTEEDVRGEIGLMVYEMLVRAHYPLHPVRITLHALRPDVRVSLERTEEERREAAAFIDRVARAIADETEWRGRPSESLCGACDFARFCPDRYTAPRETPEERGP